MSVQLRDWLAGREPSSAFDLDRWVEGAGSASADPATLARLGGRALDRALAAPGRVRESALELLAADALVTYACEAALEAEDPDEALEDILDEVSGR